MGSTLLSPVDAEGGGALEEDTSLTVDDEGPVLGPRLLSLVYAAGGVALVYDTALTWNFEGAVMGFTFILPADADGEFEFVACTASFLSV